MAHIRHETVPGDDVYSPGTYVDKNVLPAPEDARQISELLATRTPGSTKDAGCLERK